MEKRKYYEAYDERYKVAHEKSLSWFEDEPSKIVEEVIKKYSLNSSSKILELGCGEGRDAKYLLNKGFDVLATDISPEAIRFCKEHDSAHSEKYLVMDCIKGKCDEKFDFIYAIAVIHMLVLDKDRNAFYQFVCEHLDQDGIALICTMGDGKMERKTDIDAAFDLQERECNNERIMVASTSCRMVTFDKFKTELDENGFEIIEMGSTEIPLMFPWMMYAVVKKR